MSNRCFAVQFCVFCLVCFCIVHISDNRIEYLVKWNTVSCKPMQCVNWDMSARGSKQPSCDTKISLNLGWWRWRWKAEDGDDFEDKVGWWGSGWRGSVGKGTKKERWHLGTFGPDLHLPSLPKNIEFILVRIIKSFNFLSMWIVSQSKPNRTLHLKPRKFSHFLKSDQLTDATGLKHSSPLRKTALPRSPTETDFVYYILWTCKAVVSDKS